MAEAKAGNPFAPVTVVPPNTYAGIGLRRVLAGEGGLLNVGFMALARLAEQLGAPTMASQRRRPLSAASEMAVIRTVAMEVVGKEPLGSVAGHSSLHQSLQAAFKELVRLTEDELVTLAGEGPLRQATVELYRRLRDRTTEHYGPEDEAWAAAEAVRSGRGQPALQDVGALVFFLPTRPSPGETALLTALSDAAPCSFVVGRTGEAGVDDAEGAWWERLGEASGNGSQQSLSHLDVRPESIVSAPDAREEVRQAVRDMLQRAEAGVPFHRMAALYRRQDPYAFQLRMELGLHTGGGPGPVAAAGLRSGAAAYRDAGRHQGGLQPCRPHAVGWRTHRCGTPRATGQRPASCSVGRACRGKRACARLAAVEGAAPGPDREYGAASPADRGSG